MVGDSNNIQSINGKDQGQGDWDLYAAHTAHLGACSLHANTCHASSNYNVFH